MHSDMTPPELLDVLTVWFGGTDQEQLGRVRQSWFRKDPVFDDMLRQRFLGLWQDACDGKIAPQADDALSMLAWVVLTDQLPRNMFRGDARSFATDALALRAANAMVAAGQDQVLPLPAKVFVYLPFEHSEQLADQDRAIVLFDALGEGELAAGYQDYARRHRDIIVTFGRFPHRNAVLGRDNTPEETAFLQTPGSSF